MTNQSIDHIQCVGQSLPGSLDSFMADPRLRCRLTTDTHMRCDHCGEVAPMPLGGLKWIQAVLDGFIREHRDCKPKDEGVAVAGQTTP